MTDANLEERSAVRRYREAVEWLLRLKAHDVAEDDTAEWLRWCEQDPGNLKAFEKVEHDWRDVVALRNDETYQSAAQWDNPRINRLRRPAVLAFAAAIALCAVGALFWDYIGHLARAKEIVTQNANKTLSLPDGSTLTLRALSAVEFDFTPTQRWIAIKQNGEAYFKVRHDPARPFVVNAGGLRVQAVGTAFDIRQDDQQVQVTVEEGRVRILSANHREWTLGAGEHFEFAGAALDTRPRAIVAKVDPVHFLSWRDGEFGYDGVPLGDVLRDINRYSREQIVARDARTAQIPYTGTVFVRSLDDWVKALALRYPICAQMTAEGQILLEKTDAP